MRLPAADEPTKAPQEVGYAPIELQELNTPDAAGKLTLLHAPSAAPLLHRTFQLVVGGLSGSKYDVTVTARLAEDAKLSVERQLRYAKETQAQLPVIEGELEQCWESMRLFERKLLVARDMIDEAEVDLRRCERDMEACADELAADEIVRTDIPFSVAFLLSARLQLQYFSLFCPLDLTVSVFYWFVLQIARELKARELFEARYGTDASDPTVYKPKRLDDEERADLFLEIRTLELEFAHWARIYALRVEVRTIGASNRGRVGSML